MVDTKNERKMQEALDTNLEPEAYRKLLQDLKTDAEASERYEKMKSTDGMLREARTSPAPASLAESIMARIAKPETLPQSDVLKSTLALACGLGVVALIGVPVLLVISLLAVSVFGTGAAVSGVALALVGLAVSGYASLSGLAGFASEFVQAYPVVFALMLLIPLAVVGLNWLGKRGRDLDAH